MEEKNFKKMNFKSILFNKKEVDSSEGGELCAISSEDVK